MWQVATLCNACVVGAAGGGGARVSEPMGRGHVATVSLAL